MNFRFMEIEIAKRRKQSSAEPDRLSGGGDVERQRSATHYPEAPHLYPYDSLGCKLSHKA